RPPLCPRLPYTTLFRSPLLGVSGYLGALNIRRRPHQMSGSLIPIILLTAVTTGTLYTQRIDNAVTERGGPTSSDATGVQTLNYTDRKSTRLNSSHVSIS